MDLRQAHATTEAELEAGYRLAEPEVGAALIVPMWLQPLAERARRLGLVAAPSSGSRVLAEGELVTVELLGEERRIGPGEAVYWMAGDFIVPAWLEPAAAER